MNDTKQTSIGYVAVIDKKDGGFSYRGTDRDSGGYPYFEDRPVIRISLNQAIEDAETLRKMEKYYNSHKHNFNKITIYSVLLQEVPQEDLKKNSDFMLKEKLRANFSEEEIKKLKDVL